MSTEDTKQTDKTPSSDYVLTPDERGMLDAMAAAHQRAYETERAALLGAIIRYRQLGDGNWALEDGKLKRA